jgi:hypothetical protein
VDQLPLEHSLLEAHQPHAPSRSAAQDAQSP